MLRGRWKAKVMLELNRAYYYFACAPTYKKGDLDGGIAIKNIIHPSHTQYMLNASNQAPDKNKLYTRSIAI